MNPGSDVTLVYIYIPHLEQNYLSFSSFRLRLSRNRLTSNATTYTFSERSFRDLSGNVWFVALIVCRFRDKRQKPAYTLSRTFFSVNLATQDKTKILHTKNTCIIRVWLARL